MAQSGTLHPQSETRARQPSERQPARRAETRARQPSDGLSAPPVETRGRPPADRQPAALVDRATDFVRRHSIDALRISLGVVFFAFGVLKFFPGASPAAPLVERTIDTLTFGVITGTTAVVLTAVVECFIGITLITGKLLRPGLAVLAGALVGIMSPLVLFLPDMFPHGTPTLEAQYVFKDIVLAAAGLVIAVSTTRAKQHR